MKSQYNFIYWQFNEDLSADGCSYKHMKGVEVKMLKKGLEFENLGHRTPDETPVVSGFESDV